MIINFITTILVAIQVLIGQVAVPNDIDVQDNHRIWVEIQEPCFSSSVYDDDQTEYEDIWTEDLAWYLIELSTGTNVQTLAASIDDAWNKVEKRLFEKNQFKTSVLRITKNE